MKIRLILSCIVLFVSATRAENVVGWATCATHEGGTYPLKGREGERDTIVFNDGGDMYDLISNAINQYDIVILDGSKGPIPHCHPRW